VIHLEFAGDSDLHLSSQSYAASILRFLGPLFVPTTEWVSFPKRFKNPAKALAKAGSGERCALGEKYMVPYAPVADRNRGSTR
jgi:hypothetical protein